MACLQRRDKRENTPGSTLPTMRLFRFEVVESFLNGGIPLAKTDSLRPVLEKHGHRLTSSSHLALLNPAVLEKEKDKLQDKQVGRTVNR